MSNVNCKIKYNYVECCRVIFIIFSWIRFWKIFSPEALPGAPRFEAEPVTLWYQQHWKGIQDSHRKLQQMSLKFQIKHVRLMHLESLKLSKFKESKPNKTQTKKRLKKLRTCSLCLCLYRTRLLQSWTFLSWWPGNGSMYRDLLISEYPKKHLAQFARH